ncbi:hypothetical protein B0A49_13634, partial [Cryomyces minteri]
MFMVLTKRKHYLRPGKDLTLDWRPLYKELKVFVLPSESAAVLNFSNKRNPRTITKMCTFAQLYFDPKEIPAILDELLPFFSTSSSETGFVVVGLLNLLLPTYQPPTDDPKLLPQHYLPTFFHLWTLISRSRMMDTNAIDLISRLARDCLSAERVPFSQHGIFTAEQSALIYTAILRLLDIPVGQATTPYSSTVDHSAGLAVFLERDNRKHPVAHNIARWMVMSMSPACLDQPDSILAHLEGLIQGVETFFHPSNSGVWTKNLSQLVYYLTDFFVMRWNREHNGEYEVPEGRRLNEEVKTRFVLCLREVVFMGIYAKSVTAMTYSLSALQSLAYLEPRLILPGALQRIYPAMQGLVEVHRTVSSIRALQMLSKTMARTKGFRCHLTTMLGLALPGIDANDLDKTMHTLGFIQSVCYIIPFHDLTKEKTLENTDNDEGSGDTALAVRWITEQVERFEVEGPDVEVDYEKELTDHDEELILRSSTTGFAEFVSSFLGRVFILLQNLPDASRVKSGSPEENVVNTLPATFTPLLAALSPELYELALNKISQFVTNHVVHQARDAMAFICNAVVKINPKVALARLLPDLIGSIRTEIDENGAGSTRTTGAEILPRDRALVWHISLLSMCVVHVGSEVLEYRRELFEIATHMQDKCKGIPLVHVSNFIHHLLLNLTVTYTTDYSIYEKEELERGLTAQDWGKIINPKDLTIEWHTPSREEIDFAIELFESQAERAIAALTALTGANSPIKRDGTGKDWSDEVSRNLTLLRLVISGISRLFYSDDTTITPRTHRDIAMNGTAHGTGIAREESSPNEDDSDEADLGESDDKQIRISFQYPTGYPLEVGSAQYELVHRIRHSAGEILHHVHEFLVAKQEDDVPCFSSLYTAYRSWFVDVGIERSAHVLDRLTRLLHADTHPYKFSGLRKEYPRPLLVRRANVYHCQRLRHNESPRVMSDLDEKLLLDLAHSSVSVYIDIRRTAQSASESAVKCVVGARPLVIPPLLDALDSAVRAMDYPRIKGGVYSLLFGSLARTIGRNWRFAPRVIKLFVAVTEADRPSIQKLAANASFQILDMAKPLMRMVILDQETVNAVYPPASDQGSHSRTIEEAKAKASKQKDRMRRRRTNIEKSKEKLAGELIEEIGHSHWRKTSRILTYAMVLDCRFETIASDGIIDLVVKGAIDPHPSLRMLYSGSLLSMFSLTVSRPLVDHSYENFLLEKQFFPDKVDVPVPREDPGWTKDYLYSFAKPEAKYYVDQDHPGWLVWGKTLKANTVFSEELKYDEVENHVRKRIASMLDRHWFSTYFDFMKQEPRDQTADRFRTSTATTLMYTFDLIRAGLTKATIDDIKDLAQAVYGDGSDKHQHRATAEIMSALLATSDDCDEKARSDIWAYVFPIVRRILTNGLTPENFGYWGSFVMTQLNQRDPRRSWPLVEWIAGFKLDMDSNAAFKESSKIQLLNYLVTTTGWHFQLEKPIVEDFMKHLDHPYKGVREAMGGTLASVFKSRYYEAYPDVESLVQAQKAASSIGVWPRQPTEEYTKLVTDVFERLEVWRQARPAGQQTPSPYTQGSKTVLLWLDSTLSSLECIQLVKFFPDVFMEQLLHMMDIKEDPELQSLAYHVFRHLPNIPHAAGEDVDFVNALIRIGKTSKSWHQRLRILINMQVVYFRRLFLMGRAQQEALLECVSDMLSDTQLEVRLGAAATMSGMMLLAHRFPHRHCRKPKDK